MQKGFIVYQVNCSGNPFLSWSTGDQGDDLMTFETKKDALLEIADHIESVGDAVKMGNMDEDALDEAIRNNFVAEYEIEDGIITVFEVDNHNNPETVLSGDVTKWRDL